MKVEFRKSFEKDIRKIRDGDLLAKIKAVLEEVENAEILLDVNNTKKLKADGNYYRIRVGNYRVGFTEDEDVITFVRVLHRKEIYRYFP
ncbi:type II toxin-antitoxin system RelE/ParE family toxin [Lusitaniella coriacea LEGE 07157]|uniref:Type II toxin-antitoxin system RelE/ParE family toxin n=1 Tax=Lusitaniella coriacea LEGE 07157 TaxID=945747 RepID=A0A8J7JB05_9CYAN|nr:type II toxin-antitoxin system RelE/ParE family toxin [Lusitaniella coriacea]MBE9116595.1 type II toxin-antitoxin system RelE/ParE family toxin [Lusitaniella coriacea LEGE 07157]